MFKVSNTENIIKIGIGVGNVYEGKVCSLGILNGLAPLHVAVYSNLPKIRVGPFNRVDGRFLRN